jgi:Right handed beta helix region
MCKVLQLSFLLSVFVCLTGRAMSQASNSEASKLEASKSDQVELELRKADELWLQDSHVKAARIYRGLLKSKAVPGEVRPLILLRLARVELILGREHAVRRTLGELEGLHGLPRHHKMASAELRLRLNGVGGAAEDRTPERSWPRSAAIIHVRDQSLRGDGTAAHPWGTIQEALSQARGLRKAGGLPAGPIEIRLSGPILSVRETIHLTTEDSGTQRNPLLLRGADPEAIQLSGQVTLRHWGKVTDRAILDRLPNQVRGRVLEAAFGKNGVPPQEPLEFGGFSSVRAKGVSHRFRTFAVPELFYGGNAQPMARWPNRGDVQSPLKAFVTDRPVRWVAEKELWLHGYWHHSWADAYEKVQRVDVDNRTIHLLPPTNRYGFGRSQWHAVNALAELDQVGEWHFDSAAGKIHYLPPDGFDPESCQLSCHGPILVAADCQHLVLEHLDIRYVRGDCMVFRGCSDLILQDCSMSRSSGYGLVIEGGKRHLVLRCKIQSMGRGGMDLSAGNRIRLESSESLVENCVISDLSRIDRTYTPAVLLEGIGVRVRHCRFDLIPSSAIRMEGNDMLIELNEFTRCVWESDDQGAIDMWGNPTYRGNVIRWNSFHDNVKPKAHYVAGVRLDDAICGTAITENLFINTSNGRFGGTQIHGGKDNHVEGNLFLDCGIAMSQTPWGEKRWMQKTTSHPAIAKSLAVTPWQSLAWTKRYPRLSTLMKAPWDRNYFADNIAIGSKSLFARKSATSPSFNDRMLEGQPSASRASVIQAHLVPWHPIPWKSIGPYGPK